MQKYLFSILLFCGLGAIDGNANALVDFMKRERGGEYQSFKPYVTPLIKATATPQKPHKWTKSDHQLFGILKEAVRWADYSYDINDPIYKEFKKQIAEQGWVLKVHHFKKGIINVIVAFKGNTVLIAIPGTQNARDVKMDLNSKRARMQFLVEIVGKEGVDPQEKDINTKVHKGFYNRYKEIIGHIVGDIQAHYGKEVKQDDLSILITGHSAGGAVSVIVGAHLVGTNLFKTDSKKPIALKELGNRMQARCNTPTSAIKIITFGAPRVGGREFGKMFRDCVGEDNLLRVVNQGDPVPTVPPRPIFKHLGFQLKVFEKTGRLQILVRDSTQLQEGSKHWKLKKFIKSFKGSNHSADIYRDRIDHFAAQEVGNIY